MAKLKKLPKKPKQSASLQAFKNYKDKVSEVQKHNRAVIADGKKREKLKKEIAGFKPKAY